MNTLPPLPLIGGALFIDNSGWVEGMSTCHRLLQFRSLARRVGAGEKVSLNFGSAIHTALELRYSLYGNKPVDKTYYDDLAVLLTDFFNQHPPPGDDWRGLNWCMETIRRYNDRYEQEEFNLLEYPEPIGCPHCQGNGEKWEDASVQATIPCPWCRGTGKRRYIVELPFAVPLYEHVPSGVLPNGTGDVIPVIYTGRIDLPVMIEGGLYTKDHKTTSQLGDWFWYEQRISSQHRGYCWAMQQATGLTPKGYIVNGIRTKQPPQYVQNGTAWKGKTQNPAQWWQESLARDRMILHPGELDRWKVNTIDLVEEFFWHYTRGYMPMKTKWCNSYGKCQYYDVCRLMPEEQGPFLASGLFTDNKWSPLAEPSQAKQ